MSEVFQLCQTAVLHICATLFLFDQSTHRLQLVSQLRPFSLEGSQRFGKTTYVWVSTALTQLKCALKKRSFVVSFFVGVSSGALLVFDIPSKGSNITLSEILEEHKEAITDLASECSGSQVWMLLSSVCIHGYFMYIVHEM